MKVKVATEREDLKTVLRVSHQLYYPVDHLHFPKLLSGGNGQDEKYWTVWNAFSALRSEIDALAHSPSSQHAICLATEVYSRSVAKRKAAETELRERMVARKREMTRCVRRVYRKIARIQKQQAELIVEARTVNSGIALGNRKRCQCEREAVASGRFWEAREHVIKKLFNPPFSGNRLVDVDEEHRAALFVAVVLEEYPYKQLISDGRAYLCGIDDNGEEWGFVCPSTDYTYNSNVVEAMRDCWDVSESTINESLRQGEILVSPEDAHPENRLADTKLIEAMRWAPAAQHEIVGDIAHDNDESLVVRSTVRCVLRHPTHADVIIPAGRYRVRVHDADPDPD